MKRFLKVATDFHALLGASIPQASGNWSTSQAVQRLDRKRRDHSRMRARESLRRNFPGALIGQAIDAEITRAALQAETATAAKSFGYPWSPTLAEAGQRVTLWKTAFAQLNIVSIHFSTLSQASSNTMASPMLGSVMHSTDLD